MLKSPNAGWSRITIGDWSNRCSYLDDVPYLLLEGVEEVCRTGYPVVSKFDAEGYEYFIVIDIDTVFIITETDDGYSLKTIEISIKGLAAELIADIRRDLDLWSEWVDYGDMSEDEKRERKKDLSALCEIIEKRISNANRR